MELTQAIAMDVVIHWRSGKLKNVRVALVNVRGGKREGAGRKPRQDGQGRTHPKSMKVSQQVDDYLTEHGTGLIEDLIRKSKAFRDWLKRQQ